MRPVISVIILLGLMAISSRPADAQSTLYIPVLATDSADSMLALTNLSLEPATLTLTARGYDGAVLEGYGIINPVSITLPPSSSRTFKAKEVFGEGLTPGWGEVQTSSPSVSGGFFLLDSNQTALDGGKLQTTAAGRLIFPKA